jgi:hypothetical protein
MAVPTADGPPARGDPSPGSRLTPRTRRLIGALVKVAVVVLVGLWAWSAGQHGLHAARHLVHGRSVAERAKGETTASEIESGPLLVNLSRAHDDFAKAHAELGSWSVRSLDWLPVLGRQIRSARALAGAGVTVSAAASDAVVELRGELRAVPADGPSRLARMTRFLAVARTAQARVDQVSLGPRVGLISPLATAHNELLDELVKARTGLRRGVAATQAVVDLLSGHHQVLVLVTSNAEMRAESGMVEDLATLTIDNGRLRFTDRGSAGQFDLNPGVVRPTGALETLWGWAEPTQHFDELLASPRFDLTAPLASRMWTAAGQGPVDAVMAVDPVFLRNVLKVTGAVTGLGGPIDASNVVAELLHDQYLAFPAPGAQTRQRKDELGVFAGRVFDRLDAGGFSLLRMGLATAEASRGRHVLVWSAAPADQAAWTTAGAAGTLGPQSLGVSIENRGRNKLDYHVSSQATLTLRTSSDQTFVTLVVQLHNAAQPGEPAEIDGPSPGAEASLLPGQQRLVAADYLGIVALTLPASATDVQIPDNPPARIRGPDGPTQVVGDQYVIPHGQDFSLTVTFRLPGRHGVVDLEPAARVPELTWHVGPTTYGGDSSRILQW